VNCYWEHPWEIHWELEEHDWEPKQHHWQYDRNTRILKIHPLSILFLDHFACKMGLQTSISIEILQPGNYRAHLMTAPQIPQCNNKKFGAYLAFPPIYMWPFTMQTLVRCATCHKHSLALSSSPNLQVIVFYKRSFILWQRWCKA